MKHSLQVELIKKALRLIQLRQTDMAGEMMSTPVENYFSAEHLRREQEILFRRFPLVVGFSSQVAKAGDFFTHGLTGVPILVARDQEGGLNAFLNVCRHRNAQLATEPCGSGKSHFVCPYHGWSYNIDGKLRGMTYPAGFPGLDKEAHGLVRLAVAERYGMVFVLPTPGLTFDIDEFLGPLMVDLETLGLSNHVLMETRTYHRRMNWKLQVDAALETYHFHYLHEGTLEGYYPNIGVLDWAKPHARIVVPKRSMLKLLGTDPATWNLPENSALLYSIFPNVGVFVGGGNAHVLCTFPVDADTTILYGGMLVPSGAADERTVELRKFYHDHYWRSQTEDMVIAESVQVSLRSGANKELLFGRQEYLVGRFHAAMKDALNGDLNFTRSLSE
jgi:phenylpropionate dioxygenase-like ring-hydroxylating dioxygenase large terminal subunit